MTLDIVVKSGINADGFDAVIRDGSETVYE